MDFTLLDCKHLGTTEFVRQKMSNGRYQLKKQCQVCGYVFGEAFKFSLVKDINLVPELDQEKRENLSLLWQMKHSNEQEERKRIYEEYINSTHWNEKRLLAIDRDEGLCVLCKAKGTQVHHLTYKNFGNEDLRDIILLCADCHKYIHE